MATVDYIARAQLEHLGRNNHVIDQTFLHLQTNKRYPGLRPCADAAALRFDASIFRRPHPSYSSAQEHQRQRSAVQVIQEQDTLPVYIGAARLGLPASHNAAP